MTESMRLQLRMSETREAVNDLVADDSAEATPKREKLAGELKALEAEYRAAIETESRGVDGTPESREWADLTDRFDVGKLFDGVVNHRAASGTIAEVQSERGLGANALPVELLMEKRAVTEAPGQVGQNQSQIEGYVFPASVAAFIGVPSPIVPVGDSAYPVLTSAVNAGTPAEHAAQAETDGTFSANVLSPSRIQASFFWSREDSGRMAGMGDALREALQGGIADKLDSEIMRGTNGLLTGMNLDNHVRATASDYASYVADLLYGRVDGQYAADLSDIRVVMGAETFGNAATKMPTNGEVNALARIRNDSGGVRVSAHVPVAASDKQNAVVRLGNRRDMVAPVWGAVTLIPDEITKAANGQIVLTAVLLHAVKILRVGGFYKLETNHS